MIELDLVFFISAFVAGVLMFLAPCTLPLVPAYLAFISGVQPNDILKNSEAKGRVHKNASAFVLGFSAVFITFGVLAGLAGSFIGPFRLILMQVGGAFIILFGLLMLQVVVMPAVLKERHLTLPKIFKPGEPQSAFLIGVAFAVGWTPCVGPVLASVLVLASTGATAGWGALLLGIFSLGLAIPFLLVAFLYGRASHLINNYQRFSQGVNIIGGVFLIFLGTLLLTNSFGLFVQYGYSLFNWLGLSVLFEYI